MRIILLCFLFTTGLFVRAQRVCGSADYIQSQKADTRAFQTLAAAGEFIDRQAGDPASQAESTLETSTASIIRIPVVVHILYNSAALNISDEQVRSQLAALNRDFRRQNWDSSNTPARFRNLAADTHIEFVLATADPYGGPTNGIVRKQTNVAEWTNDDKIKFSASGGDNAWDSRYYLNIWVGKLRRLMGYSSAPGSPADRDGIVINSSAFGTINTVAPYGLGRTAVHEAGHWLGLQHIWGDSYCGSDGVDDTPQQGNFTPGCPTGFRTSCSNGTNGDMYMNYMDFTYDACINLFTKGQSARMRAGFLQGGPRYMITTSRGLDSAWTNGKPAEATTATAPVAVKLYPNPAVNSISLHSGDASLAGKNLRIVNMNGVTVLQTRAGSNIHVIDISRLPAGQYMITGENGGQKI